MTSQAVSTSPLAIWYVRNEGDNTCGLRVQSYWCGSAAQPYQNNDDSLFEVFNTTASDSRNRSWAVSACNAMNNIPEGVTDSGTRVGILGWAPSITYQGYRHDGTLTEQVGVSGTAGFQGSVPSGPNARVIEAVAVRGVIQTDSPGATIDNAIGGQFVTRATSTHIKRNTAVYASARGGDVNYSLYGEGLLHNDGDAEVTGRVTMGKNPIWPGKTPASAHAPGDTGEVSWDGEYVYVCVAMNTWKRAALSAW